MIVDGVKKDEMPTNSMGKDNKYYQVDVTCTSSKTTGLWDYNAWRLNLDYIESNSKCNLTFTSTLSKADYDKYIESGVALRRNTYRGKDITKYYTGEEKINDKDLYKQISDGTFDDIYVGDYIVSEHADESGGKIVWLIADLDNYLGTGNPNALTKHHVTIVPAYKLQDSRMNPISSTLAGASQIEEAKELAGYMGSEMYQTTLNTVYDKYIKPDFCRSSSDCHIIEYLNLVSKSVDEKATNQYVQNTGASSGWSWETRKLDLMSEVNVYGTTVWSSSGWDVGADNKQYAIFRLKPELINKSVSAISGATTGNYWYWLKAVVSSTNFASVAGDGGVFLESASNPTHRGVRPRFLID